MGGADGGAGVCDSSISTACGVTEKCVFDCPGSKWGCKAAGGGVSGDPCSGDSMCARGLICLEPRSGGPKECRKWCSANSDCGASTCYGAVNCASVVVGRVCDGGCNLMTAAGCAGAQTCVFNCMANAPMCVASGGKTQGQPCSGLGVGECAPGFGCYDSKCLKHCDASKDCTGMGTSCTGLLCTKGGKPLPGVNICS
jgi:hypothetical protein